MSGETVKNAEDRKKKKIKQWIKWKPVDSAVKGGGHVCKNQKTLTDY